VRVGAAVTSVAAADLVVCVPPDGLGSRLVTDERWVARAPAASAPEEAVAGTMAYATAWLALLRQARIARGDCVLIHSAAGGVGLAAVPYCLPKSPSP
jgi:NADPH:quinone reductase-like Zn-dependent oxidoreductase